MNEQHSCPYIFGKPLSGEFTLACTTTVRDTEIPFKICLEALHQSLTYAGVLEGYPSQYANQRIIKRKVENARKLLGTFPPHVITPREEVVKLNGEDSDSEADSDSEWDSDRTIFVLPAVCCFGSFKSEYSTDACDYSMLTVVWFQDDWAFPMQDDIISALRSLPWTSLAQSCWY